MYSLYKIGIRLYYFLIRLISPFSSRAAEWHRGRKIQAKVAMDKPPPGKPVTWFHASSLGEFEQGLPLIEKWREKKPDHFILLTFYSPSGYRMRKNFEGVDRVMFLPRDTVAEVKSFLDHFNPGTAVFIKYDIWPVLIRETARRRISLYLVSAIFREEQLFFRWYGRWYLSLLKSFTGIFVQDENSSRLLKGKGLHNVILSGDTRIDRVLTLAADSSVPEGIDRFTDGQKVLVAGSSWPKEEHFLRRFLAENPDTKVKIIIAPHDISQSHLDAIGKMFGDALVCYSRILEKPESAQGKKVLLIDRIGLLSRLYRVGDIAFIGGAFGAGLHNILEPAVFELAIVFGPYYHKFVEAVELVKSEAGFSVSSYDEFERIITILIRDQNTLSNAGKGCRRYVENHKGATSLIISHLLEKV